MTLLLQVLFLQNKILESLVSIITALTGSKFIPHLPSIYEDSIEDHIGEDVGED